MKSIITAEIEIVALGTESTSMSSHISDAVKAIEKLGIKYQLTPMGTVIEVSSIDEVFSATIAVHEEVIKKGIKRVITHITIDDRRDVPIESIKSKI